MEADGTGALKPILQILPLIDCSRCTGCGRCVAACPEKIITLEVSGYRKCAAIRQTERCVSCGCCVNNCPFEAISF